MGGCHLLYMSYQQSPFCCCLQMYPTTSVGSVLHFLMCTSMLLFFHIQVLYVQTTAEGSTLGRSKPPTMCSTVGCMCPLYRLYIFYKVRKCLSVETLKGAADCVNYKHVHWCPLWAWMSILVAGIISCFSLIVSIDQS